MRGFVGLVCLLTLPLLIAIGCDSSGANSGTGGDGGAGGGGGAAGVGGSGGESGASGSGGAGNGGAGGGAGTGGTGGAAGGGGAGGTGGAAGMGGTGGTGGTSGNGGGAGSGGTAGGGGMGGVGGSGGAGGTAGGAGVDGNGCPRLFSVIPIPSTIPEGEDSTEVQVSADDPDSGPLLLTTTLYAVRGTFDDANARVTIYTCERPGLIEICADASDGACVKTLCTDVRCPEDLGN